MKRSDRKLIRMRPTWVRRLLVKGSMPLSAAQEKQIVQRDLRAFASFANYHWLLSKAPFRLPIKSISAAAY